MQTSRSSLQGLVERLVRVLHLKKELPGLELRQLVARLHVVQAHQPLHQRVPPCAPSAPSNGAGAPASFHSSVVATAPGMYVGPRVVEILGFQVKPNMAILTGR